MNDAIKQALATNRTIDITTTGRTSGLPRRIEIWFHNITGRIFITGLPGSRDWHKNMVATPAFTFHLKESVQADLPAQARVISDEAERREVIAKIHNNLDGERDLEEWVERSPLVEVTFVN